MNSNFVTEEPSRERIEEELAEIKRRLLELETFLEEQIKLKRKNSELGEEIQILKERNVKISDGLNNNLMDFKSLMEAIKRLNEAYERVSKEKEKLEIEQEELNKKIKK